MSGKGTAAEYAGINVFAQTNCLLVKNENICYENI